MKIDRTVSCAPVSCRPTPIHSRRVVAVRRWILSLVLLLLFCGAAYGTARMLRVCWQQLTAGFSLPFSNDNEQLAWIRSHRELYPSGLPDKAADNPGPIEFLYNWQNGGVHGTEAATLTEVELAQAVPLLMQWDARWGYAAYGSSVLGITGCGPTCLSMAVIGLTGDTTATPCALAEFATSNGYYVDGVGTAWSLMPAAAEAYGLDCRMIDVTQSAMQAALDGGAVLICSMGPGHFTTEGHFIVITSGKDGSFTVNDPNSASNSARAWDFNDIQHEFKAVWAFTEAA